MISVSNCQDWSGFKVRRIRPEIPFLLLTLTVLHVIGWNDMISEPKVQEYEYNLANLIRDMRDDLDAPMMPVLVGGMGQLGVNASGRYVVSEINLR